MQMRESNSARDWFSDCWEVCLSKSPPQTLSPPQTFPPPIHDENSFSPCKPYPDPSFSYQLLFDQDISDGRSWKNFRSSTQRHGLSQGSDSHDLGDECDTRRETRVEHQKSLEFTAPPLLLTFLHSVPQLLTSSCCCAPRSLQQ